LTGRHLYQIELVAGPDDANLEDRLGKLDEDHEIARDVGRASSATWPRRWSTSSSTTSTCSRWPWTPGRSC